jgi:hypothetical protein
MPRSACAKADTESVLQFYKSEGYAGVFVTDHFIDGNVDHSLRSLPYEEKIERYFDAFNDIELIAKQVGISVFQAFESSFAGTDFLVYGIDMDFCLQNPDMDKLPKTELLSRFIDNGALVIQAHPFREARYIDHIRLFPRHVHGAEVFNSYGTDFENSLAEQYAENYKLLRFAGSDNHLGPGVKRLGGMATDRLITDVDDFKKLVFTGMTRPFKKENGEIVFI